MNLVYSRGSQHVGYVTGMGRLFGKIYNRPTTQHMLLSVQEIIQQRAHELLPSTDFSFSEKFNSNI